jgi:hypothetical protein
MHLAARQMISIHGSHSVNNVPVLYVITTIHEVDVPPRHHQPVLGPQVRNVT